jgi:hypothetical protein
VNFRARDLWITAATSIPLGMAVMLVLLGAGQAGSVKPHGTLVLVELGALIGPIGALGGGIALLLAKRRLYVRAPWLLVVLVAIGSGLLLWFVLVLFAVMKIGGPGDDGVVALFQALIGLFLPVMLSGAIPAALAFGTLTWIRLRIPPPPGTEMGAYHGPEGGPSPDTQLGR